MPTWPTRTSATPRVTAIIPAHNGATFGPPVRLIRVQHGNTQATRNAAIAASDSEFIGVLDQDDAWWPEKIEHQLARLDADPAPALCYTDTRGVDEVGRSAVRTNSLAESDVTGIMIKATLTHTLSRRTRLRTRRPTLDAECIELDTSL